ncbi:MAG: methyltransferase domain-containing protein [Proteobacteria bacterium]|nr:methyltransferase domain-containing protein [Pseudomonadota bacterium]MDA1058151.1 methyltransferase domain-containing protein [Pseudomonadota bacterium]
MSRTIETTMTPLIVGILALGLLRHWRHRDHVDLADWMALAKGAIDEDAASAPLIAHHFDAIAGYAAWADTYDGGNPLIAREQAVLEGMLTTERGSRALDAACGTGRIAEILLRNGHEVVGIDQSTAMLDRARTRLPRVRFETGSLDGLPVDDGSFDLVVCGLALTHVDDLGGAVAELARAVKPGGRIIVSEVHPFNVMLGAQASFSMDGDAMGVIPNNEYTVGDYVRAFGQAGLTIVDLQEPAFREAEVAQACAAFSARLGTGALDAFRAALLGFPMALIWDLRKN